MLQVLYSSITTLGFAFSLGLGYGLLGTQSEHAAVLLVGLLGLTLSFMIGSWLQSNSRVIENNILILGSVIHTVSILTWFATDISGHILMTSPAFIAGIWLGFTAHSDYEKSRLHQQYTWVPDSSWRLVLIPYYYYKYSKNSN